MDLLRVIVAMLASVAVLIAPVCALAKPLSGIAAAPHAAHATSVGESPCAPEPAKDPCAVACVALCGFLVAPSALSPAPVAAGPVFAQFDAALDGAAPSPPAPPPR